MTSNYIKKQDKIFSTTSHSRFDAFTDIATFIAFTDMLVMLARNLMLASKQSDHLLTKHIEKTI